MSVGILIFLDTDENEQGCDNQATSSTLTAVTDSMYLVTFNNQPCDQMPQSHPFCGNSGWGDEEASVVCRNERNSRYGIGGE